MTGAGGGVGIASRYGERLPTWQPPLLYLQITSVDLMHLKARLFLEGAGFNVDSSRTGPERLI